MTECAKCKIQGHLLYVKHKILERADTGLRWVASSGSDDKVFLRLKGLFVSSEAFAEHGIVFVKDIENVCQNCLNKAYDEVEQYNMKKITEGNENG